ncbi:hypothetical protein CRE_14714 [Caenorhabditis remanei]|uniref:Uncharacterized protein n=1 Tax=Caenorhabditis remanei TaxID=31234 RepID=E3M9Q0_CAERE|nr:hypothetical protein CRE_14714 [Caenorhabditis remanei]
MNLLLAIFLILPVLARPQDQLECPSGYTLVIDKCLMVIKTPMRHLEAESACTYNGGTLVNIKDAITNRAVTQFAATTGIDKTWIGLFCFENKNTSMCYYDDNTGSILDYNSFASGYPMVDGIYGGCVYMPTTGSLAGKWVSVKCEAESIPVMCEVPVSVYVANHDCKFADARRICQDKNADLVSIHSKREVDYIKSLYRGSKSQVLIGAQQVFSNTYTWLDGHDWNSFDYRDPLDQQRTDFNCLTMDSATGLWNRASCDYEYAFLCKRPIAWSTVKPPTETVLAQNPSDFSNCNTTLLMTPGTITSYGYLSTSPPEPAVYCTWRIVTTGPYRVRLSFTDISTYNDIYVYNEDGTTFARVRYSQSVISPSNIVTVDFQATGRAGYKGFRAVALAY